MLESLQLREPLRKLFVICFKDWLSVTEELPCCSKWLLWINHQNFIDWINYKESNFIDYFKDHVSSMEHLQWKCIRIIEEVSFIISVFLSWWIKTHNVKRVLKFSCKICVVFNRWSWFYILVYIVFSLFVKVKYSRILRFSLA